MPLADVNFFPSGIYPFRGNVDPRPVNTVFRADSGATQTTTRSGGAWSHSTGFQNLREAKRRLLRSYITGLNGQELRATIPVFDYDGPAKASTALLNVYPCLLYTSPSPRD